MSDGEGINRREFLRSLGRGAALGALVLGGAGLLARSQGLCAYDFACAHCPIQSECRWTDTPGVAAPARPAARQGSDGEDSGAR